MGCGASTAGPPPEGALAPASQANVTDDMTPVNAAPPTATKKRGSVTERARGSVVGAMPSFGNKNKRVRVPSESIVDSPFVEQNQSVKYVAPEQAPPRRASLSIPKNQALRKSSDDLGSPGGGPGARVLGATGTRRLGRSSRGISISEELPIAEGDEEDANSAPPMLANSPEKLFVVSDGSLIGDVAAAVPAVPDEEFDAPAPAAAAVEPALKPDAEALPGEAVTE